MAHAFDKPLPGETLKQYLTRHHCGLNDPLNEGMSADEFDALAGGQTAGDPPCDDSNSSLLDSLIHAANDGNAQAQNQLGDLYREGEVVTQDPAEALRWYRLAADQGDPHGQNNLGSMYLNGLGVEQNLAKAVKWYRLAAEQGEPTAQYNLGVRYREGEGVALDLGKAAKWLKLAAEAGDPYAQNDYGVMVRFGNGMPQDIAAAAQWFLRAAEQGDVVALGNLTDMADELQTLARNGSNKQLLESVKRILRKWQS